MAGNTGNPFQALTRDSRDPVDEFRALSHGIATYYQKRGARVKAYHSPSLPHFSRLSLAKKQSALYYMRRLAEITQHHIAHRVDVENNAISLWSALKIYGLTPSGDLFNHLEADDKIEVYSTGGIQVWRNCGVMKICSYTLEEIHSFDWQERYDRGEEDNHKILTAISQLFSGKGRGVRAMIPSHIVTEKFSESRLRLDVRHDYFFPLMGSDDTMKAFLVTSKVEILPRANPRPRPPRLELVADAEPGS